MKVPWVPAALALCALMAAASRLQPAVPAKDFSAKDVAEIKAELGKLNPSSYRVVLPVFRGRSRVGSQTIGTLPLTEVRRVASLRGVAFKEKGNLQMILSQGNDGGGGGGGGGGDTGGGAGSHTPSQSAAKGQDVINRIQLVVSRIGQSRYVFIH
jgi:hypothetical protein